MRDCPSVFVPNLEVRPVMFATRRYRGSMGVLLASAAALWGMDVRFNPARASDVYFPANHAYNRGNYDPFDQTKPASFENEVAASGYDSSDIQLTSEIRVIGAERFQKSSDVTSPAPTPQLVPAALQVAPPTAPEPLPTPPSTRSAKPDEPGAGWVPTPLADLTTNIALPSDGDFPYNYWNERAPQHVAFFDPSGQTRGWPVNSFDWVASCFCCNPLYFEEVNLERYGYGCGCWGPCCTTCVQSAVSGAHFFANVVALPYKMGVDCPCDCDYTLGHYRPGSCPPWRWTCCSRCSARARYRPAAWRRGWFS